MQACTTCLHTKNFCSLCCYYYFVLYYYYCVLSQASELNNGVINAAFMLMFRDLIRLFACYNDGIINLLEKYFEMNKKQVGFYYLFYLIT